MGVVGLLYEWQLPLERRALAAAAELAALAPGEPLLDVATGTGALPRELAARGARPSEAVGLDSSASMLAVAAPRYRPTGRFCGATPSLPFADQSFGLVSACYLLHPLGPDDRIQVLAEMARVLRPGGRVVTVTTYSCRRPLTRTLLERLPLRSGLRALDPSPEFGAAGLRPLRARFVPSAWPSLCVLGERPSNA